MPPVYVRTFAVSEESIDANRHVNNLEYLRWMQDVALQHSAAQGWPLERYRETRTAWVVRSHSIEYLRPAFAGDELSLLTWVSGYRRRSSTRKYLFWRAGDGQVVATAETLWVLVELPSGRPCVIPEDLKTAFEVVSDGDARLEAARLKGPAGL